MGNLTAHPFLLQDLALLTDESSQSRRNLVAKLALPSQLPVIEAIGLKEISTTCEVVLRFKTSLFPAALREKWGLREPIDHFEIRVKQINKKLFRAIDPKKTPTIRILCPGANEKEYNCMRQIGIFFRREFQDVFAVGEGNEELMNPAEHGSVFYHLLRQVSNHMEKVTEYSIMCDDDNLIEAFPNTSPEVLELLIVLLSRANEADIDTTERNLSMRFNPMPSVKKSNTIFDAFCEPTNGRRINTLKDKYIASGESAAKWTEKEKVCTFIASFPCAREILASDSVYREFKMNRPRAAGMIEWMVASLPARITSVASTSLPTLNASSIFAITDTTCHQHRFNALKSKHQTRFLFHGSPIRNWHSILRSGLQVHSNTTFQQTGALFGAGIYLTNKFGESFCYTLRTKTTQGNTGAPSANIADCCDGACCKGKPPLPSRAAYAVAICEVIVNDELKQFKDVIFTAEHADMVTIRILLLYDKPPPHTAQVMLDDAMTEEIKKLIEAQNATAGN